MSPGGGAAKGRRVPAGPDPLLVVFVKSDRSCIGFLLKIILLFNHI